MKIAGEGTDSSLFQQYTIKEIQDIEKKLRNDIEKKKEDLRQMVGERYQDLMSAADTITDMRVSADKVTHHIKIMEQRCNNMYSQSTPSGILQSSSFKVLQQPNESKFSLGAQMKILMDMPNMLWFAIDNGDFLRAAELFLLSLHINSTLSFDFAKGINDMKRFTVVQNQISLIRKFRYTILRVSRDAMKKESSTDFELVNILCCLLLLDDVTPKALFEEFLDMRLNSVDSVLKLDKDSSTKEQVREVAELICNTINLIHSVFSLNGEYNNLLLQTYNNIASSNKESLMNIDSSPVFTHLPTSVKDFKPKINTELPTISMEAMQKTSLRWLENVVNLVQEKLKSLLQYVNSVKGLAAICNSLDEKLNKICDESWEDVCAKVLTRSFSPYSDMLRTIFIERIKLIWDLNTEKIFNGCRKDLNETLHALSGENWSETEKDLTQFIWTESPNDLTIKPGWIMSNSSESNLEGGILGLKSQGFTPQIQNLCYNLDLKLKELLEDLESFGTASNEDNQNKPTTRESEINDLRNYTRNSTKMRLAELVNFMSALINKNASHYLHWYPFIGRFCSALTELSPNLKLCFAPVEIKTKENNGYWSAVKEMIQNCGYQALNLWGIEFVNKELLALKLVLESPDPATVLDSALTWDEREINEETEDGKRVKSTIRVPMQASSFLQSALHNICTMINQTVGHTLPRDIIKGQTKEIVRKSLDCYKIASTILNSEASESPRFVQMYALQLLFDLQYLNGVFGSSHPEFRPQIEELAATFEALIDPFDLDVFNPVLKSNLASAIHRSILLFGLLSTERVGCISAQRLGPQGQPYNLLMANSGVGRFLLLPSNSKTEKARSPIEESQKLMPAPKMTRGYGSSPSLGQTSDSDNVSKSYSFYDRFSAMGASWFGGGGAANQ